MVELKKLTIPYPASEELITAVESMMASLDGGLIKSRYVPEPNAAVAVLLTSIVKCGGHNAVWVDSLGNMFKRGDLLVVIAFKVVKPL